MVGLRGESGADHLGLRAHWDSGSAAAAALIYLLTPELMRDQGLATVQERQIGRGGERGRRGEAEQRNVATAQREEPTGEGAREVGDGGLLPPGDVGRELERLRGGLAAHLLSR